MLPIQHSTPAEGSVGGVGGRIHDYLEAAGHGDDEQGPLFRPIFNSRTGRIDKALVAEGRPFDKLRTAPPVMLRKLAAYRRQNQLDLALQELGRIERTVFMLDWLESPELRRRCPLDLEKKSLSG
jgi:hypothetical protein